MPLQFTTPPGRLVQGSAFKPNVVTEDDDKTPKLGADGKPLMQYYVGVAFAKHDPEAQAFIASLQAQARTEWPQWHNGPGGTCTNPSFSTKILDGDGLDKKGKPHASKDGFAGHWVVRFTTMYPPKGLIYDTSFGGWREATEKELVCGDYVKVEGDTKSNAPSKTDGMYMNFNKVALWQKGAPIIQGKSAEEAFGNAPPPAATQPAAVPGAHPTPPPVGAPAASPPPPAATPPVSPIVAPTSPAPAPYTGYMDPAAAAAAPPASPPPPPVAPVGPTMTAKANGVTYEAYRAQGWTDDQLRQHGLMV